MMAARNNGYNFIPAFSFLPKLIGKRRAPRSGVKEVEEGKSGEGKAINDVIHVLIVGGGVGGVYTALNLIKEGVNPHGITIVAD